LLRSSQSRVAKATLGRELMGLHLLADERLCRSLVHLGLFVLPSVGLRDLPRRRTRQELSTEG